MIRGGRAQSAGSCRATSFSLPTPMQGLARFPPRSYDRGWRLSMRRVPALALSVAVAGVMIALPAAAAKRPITLDDHSRLREVNDPQRSPEGAWVAYTVRAIDVEKDKRDTDIWMARWDGSEADPRHLLARERVAIRAGAPTASTSRSSPRAATRTRRRRAPRSGCCNRAGGEAVQLTDIKGGVERSASWSPDSTRLALVGERLRRRRRPGEEGGLEAQDRSRRS